MPDPATAGRLSRLLARGRGALVGGSRRRGWAALAHGVRVDFPVTVYLAWRWWVSVAAANIVVSGAMMLYLREHPERLSRVISSDAASPAGRARLQRLLLRTSGPRICRAGLDEQRGRHRHLPVSRSDRCWRAVDPVAERRQSGRGRGSDARRGQVRGLLRPHPAARAARADRGLRGRGHRAANRLVLDRAGRPSPCSGVGRGRPGHRGGRPGAGRRAGGLGGHRGLRDPLRPADRGPDRYRVCRRAGLPELRLRTRPSRCSRGRDRATLPSTSAKRYCRSHDR